MRRLAERIGQALLASVFLRSGCDTLRDPSRAAHIARGPLDRIARWIPVATPARVVRCNAGVHLVAGALMIANKASPLAPCALAASLVPTTLAGHAFWTTTDPQQRRQQRIHLEKNVAIIGGLVLAASTSSQYHPFGKHLWRSTHAAQD